jgi:hypothetical protein
MEFGGFMNRSNGGVALGQVMRTLLCLWTLLVATSVMAQVRPPDMAVRQMEGNVLISPDQPKIRLQVDKPFTALPVLAFPIRHDTWVERYIFVDTAPDKTVRRLVVVQFEHAQIGSSFRFVLPSPSADAVG